MVPCRGRCKIKSDLELESLRSTVAGWRFWEDMEIAETSLQEALLGVCHSDCKGASAGPQSVSN